MDSNTENDRISSEQEEVNSLNLIPERSRKSYEITYNQFMEWRAQKKIDSFSESVLLEYFTNLASKFKSSTLWTYYSMLRSTLNMHQNVKIEEYNKLRSFLKQKAENYQPKKAQTLSPEEINRFISEAPDAKYLPMKVALIMGIVGACRTNELYAMRIEDFQDLGTAFVVTVPNIRAKTSRRFMITDTFYSICKKYVNKRPPVSAFFLNFQNGKCNVQKMGINKFGGMAKEVSSYLNLPNPALYTGHCFRRSSTQISKNYELDNNTNFDSLSQNFGINNSLIDNVHSQHYSFDDGQMYNVSLDSYGFDDSNIENEEHIDSEIKVEPVEESEVTPLLLKYEPSVDTERKSQHVSVEHKPPEKRKNPDTAECSNPAKDEYFYSRDEFSHFGEIIACKLRKLADERLQSIAQFKINQIMFEMEMKSMDKYSKEINNGTKDLQNGGDPNESSCSPDLSNYCNGDY